MPRPRWLRAALVAVVLAGIALAAANHEKLSAAALHAWVEQAGAAAPLIFMGLYAIAAPLFLPGSLLTIAGGALFGPFWGGLYSLTGATVGATLAFLVARYVASDWVARRAGSRLRQLMDGVEQEGWRFVALVRLVPLFPFNVLNYALGLTRVRLVHYVAATFVCMMPGALAYAYLGYAGREAAAGSEATIQKALLALGLLGLVAFLPRLVRRLKRSPVLEAQQPNP